MKMTRKETEIPPGFWDEAHRMILLVKKRLTVSKEIKLKSRKNDGFEPKHEKQIQ